jgi:hypothetical protein
VVERVLFALVANRALAPSSKLAATGWAAHDVHLPGLTGSDYTVSDDACYRAVDWLIRVEDQIARGVFDVVAHLLNLEIDLIFFDTTSTYFETEDPDPPAWRDQRGRVLDPDAQPGGESGGEVEQGAEDPPVGAAGRAGFRTHDKSKDARDDLPQVVVVHIRGQPPTPGRRRRRPNRRGRDLFVVADHDIRGARYCRKVASRPAWDASSTITTSTMPGSIRNWSAIRYMFAASRPDLALSVGSPRSMIFPRGLTRT